MSLRVPASAGGGEGSEPLSTVNVTSLVDVFLVVLILFIVTAPLLDSGLDVELPELSTAVPATGASVVIVLDAEGSLAVDGEVVTLRELVGRAQAAVAAEPATRVFLRADRSVPYGFVMSVLDALRREGVDTATLVVQPLEDGAAPGGG